MVIHLLRGQEQCYSGIIGHFQASIWVSHALKKKEIGSHILFKIPRTHFLIRNTYLFISMMVCNVNNLVLQHSQVPV